MKKFRSHYVREVRFRDLNLDQKFEIIEQLIESQDFKIEREETPSYTSVELINPIKD